MRRYYVITKTAGVQPERKYPTGETIPESLPESYQLSQNCGNCAAYNALTKICSMYNAPVLPNYWCKSWESK